MSKCIFVQQNPKNDLIEGLYLSGIVYISSNLILGHYDEEGKYLPPSRLRNVRKYIFTPK